MNLTSSQRLSIKTEIHNKHIKQEFNIDEMCCELNIHKSQIYRFMEGDFRYLSKNLQKVCNYLRIELEQLNNSREMIEKAVDSVWDRSDSHAYKLSVAILKLGELLKTEDNVSI